MRYIYFHCEGNIFECSGISPHDLSDGVATKVQNLLLLRSELLGNYCIKNFEVIEGHEALAEKFAQPQNGFAVGDLHFVDYAQSGMPERLSEEDIKTLLYASHMRKIPQNPIFETLQNRLFWLSHDDDWYCHLYVKKQEVFFALLAYALRRISHEQQKRPRKRFWHIQKPEIEQITDIVPTMEDAVQRELYRIGGQGVLLSVTESAMSYNVYVLGRFSDMDEMNSCWERGKAVLAAQLRVSANGWTITLVENGGVSS